MARASFSTRRHHAAGLVPQLRATRNLTDLARYTSELLDTLEAETGQATGFRRNGSIAVAPHSSRIFEVADELLFLGVNADIRLAPTSKAFSGGADMAELEIALSALML